MESIGNAAWDVFEGLKVTRTQRAALTFCLLVLLVTPLAAISWTVAHGHVAWGGILALLFVVYVFFVAPKLEHPIQTALRMDGAHEGLLGAANVVLLSIVSLCQPQLAYVVAALWFVFLLVIAGAMGAWPARHVTGSLARRA